MILVIYHNGHASLPVNNFCVQQSKTLRCFITRATRKDIKDFSLDVPDSLAAEISTKDLLLIKGILLYTFRTTVWDFGNPASFHRSEPQPQQHSSPCCFPSNTFSFQMPYAFL